MNKLTLLFLFSFIVLIVNINSSNINNERKSESNETSQPSWKDKALLFTTNTLNKIESQTILLHSMLKEKYGIKYPFDLYFFFGFGFFVYFILSLLFGGKSKQVISNFN